MVKKELNFMITQAEECDKAEIEAMYLRRVKHNDDKGTHQWNPEQVTWKAFEKTYDIHDYYVGKVNGDVVCGMFVVDIDTLYWPNEAKGAALYLHKICVDPSWSGYGFSDNLISYFKQLGRDGGYAEVRLDVRKPKAKLRAMYERNGFTLVSYERFFPEYETALYNFKLK